MADHERRSSPYDLQAAATHGTSGSGGPLPHLDVIQPLFGRHDISKVIAHQDAMAREGADELGAEAFATGNRVAFAGAPSLHTAAHEAAHVVQQRAGVQLKGGLGDVGDRYETHADAVADRVVRGESAEVLLDVMAGAGRGDAPAGDSGPAPIQRIVRLSGANVVPRDHDALVSGVRGIIGRHAWTPVMERTLRTWLADRDNVIAAPSAAILAFNLCHANPDEPAAWLNGMTSAALDPAGADSRHHRREVQYHADTLVPMAVQTPQFANFSNHPDERLLRLAGPKETEDQFWERRTNKDAKMVTSKLNTISDTEEMRTIACGDKEEPSSVTWDPVRHRQHGHVYMGGRGTNRTKKRTYGRRKDFYGAETKVDGMVDGHGIMIQDDQVVLGPDQETVNKRWTQKVRKGQVSSSEDSEESSDESSDESSEAAAPSTPASAAPDSEDSSTTESFDEYDAWKELPKRGETKPSYIETQMYNYTWENAEEGKHLRGKGFENPTMDRMGWFVNLNDYGPDGEEHYVNPNKSSTTKKGTEHLRDHKYPVPKRIQYLMNDDDDEVHHYDVDNHPRANYEKPKEYDKKTRQYPRVKTRGRGNKNLGNWKCEAHVELAKQPDKSSFPHATVLKPDDPKFEGKLACRKKIPKWVSPPGSGYFDPEAMTKEDLVTPGNLAFQQFFRHEQGKDGVVMNADYDEANDQTTMKVERMKQADRWDWVGAKKAFVELHAAAKMEPPTGAKTAVANKKVEKHERLWEKLHQVIGWLREAGGVIPEIAQLNAPWNQLLDIPFSDPVHHAALQRIYGTLVAWMVTTKNSLERETVGGGAGEPNADPNGATGQRHPSLQQFFSECGQMAAYNALTFDAGTNDDAAVALHGDLAQDIDDTAVRTILNTAGRPDIPVLNVLDELGELVKMVATDDLQGLSDKHIGFTQQLGLAALNGFMRKRTLTLHLVINSSGHQGLKAVGRHWLAVKLTWQPDGGVAIEYRDSYHEDLDYTALFAGLRNFLGAVPVNVPARAQPEPKANPEPKPTAIAADDAHKRARELGDDGEHHDNKRLKRNDSVAVAGPATMSLDSGTVPVDSGTAGATPDATLSDPVDHVMDLTSS